MYMWVCICICDNDVSFENNKDSSKMFKASDDSLK